MSACRASKALQIYRIPNPKLMSWLHCQIRLNVQVRSCSVSSVCERSFRWKPRIKPFMVKSKIVWGGLISEPPWHCCVILLACNRWYYSRVVLREGFTVPINCIICGLYNINKWFVVRPRFCVITGCFFYKLWFIYRGFQQANNCLLLPIRMLSVAVGG